MPAFVPLAAAPPMAQPDSLLTAKTVVEQPNTDSLPTAKTVVEQPNTDSLSTIPKPIALSEPAALDTLRTGASTMSATPASVVRQLSARLSGTQYEATYLVQEGTQTDTVEIFIPRTPEPSAPLFRADTLIKNNCVQTAPEFEVDKLRVRMMEADKDSDKIAAMKKWSQKYCLMVKQIKALSELFGSDEQKLTFYTAVYPYTFDPEQFGQLQSTLQEARSQQQFAQQFLDPK